MIKAGIIGATGYAGEELVRILLRHPEAEIVAISSVSYEGKKISEVYPALRGYIDMELGDEDSVIEKSDVVFASLPAGISEKIAVKCMAKGAKLIDLGADFRLYDEKDYNDWYKLEYTEKSVHSQEISTYALPEIYREKIVGKKILGNPGCYPTSIALGLYPLLKAGLADTKRIIIDSKSGATGAGRGLSQTTHFPDCNEGFGAYKTEGHRHIPEIEQTLSDIAGEEVRVTFIPHLLPVNRGILSTIYVDLKGETSASEIRELYEKAYASERFVRVLPEGAVANIKNIKYSNNCDISIHVDKRTNRAIIISAIDNMVKGAAGQAVQNMNILFGLDEACGLDAVPPAF